MVVTCPSAFSAARRVPARLLVAGAVCSATLWSLLLLLNAVQLPHDQRVYVPRLPAFMGPQWHSSCPKTHVDMLLALTDWMDANDVAYFLGFGTLLGAVRQQKIIPWDSDVDIVVPHLQTDRVQGLFNRNLPRCFTFGKTGRADQFIFHLYTHSPSVDRVTPNVGAILPGVTQEVYVDIYGMVMESRGTGYKAGYVAGSLMAAQKAGTASMQQSSCCWVQYDRLFPRNVTGATIAGHYFATPRQPAAILDVLYGPGWQKIPCRPSGVHGKAPSVDEEC